jgi:threonyl-tRNA synthetase
MKTLNLHVDYIEFQPLKKALKSVPDLKEEEKKLKKIEEALVVLIAVEKRDLNIKTIVSKLVEDIENTTKQVNVKNVVLYPYAHLSNNLSSPEIALNVLIEAEKQLSKKGFKVTRAPFGYYKSFELKVKGHPLSELSREIIVEEKIPPSGPQPPTLHRGVEEEKYDYKQLLREISKSKLDTSKLKESDHRILGQQMNLFSFSEVAPGMVFWHDNGLIVYNELAKYWRERHKENGYQEVKTPEILDRKLWQISGHWEKYRENNFSTEYEKRKFLIKPMSCPGGIIIFKNAPKSYKELPLRVAELGTVHRVELSGVLAGLFRVIQFTQDDAHIYCTEEQIEKELKDVVNLTNSFYVKFGLNLDHIELSTRPEKRIGSEEMWDKSEKALEEVLKKLKVKYKINKGDGAFYGPKIDFHLKDSLGRAWQCGTVQLDFSMPERFEIEYTDKNNEKKRPVMIHNAIYGSLERFLGILLEHTNGRLPTWLAPVQVRILSFTDRNLKYSEKILAELKKEVPYLRIDFDFSQTTVPSKVKDAELMKIPYIIVIGDKEEKEKFLAVRVRGSSKIEKFKIDAFVKKIRKEIEERL